MNTTKRDLNIEELVLLLRANCPIFAKKVGGLSAFNNVTIPSLNLSLPYCIVSKVTTFGQEYNKANGTQRRNAMISFIVCVDNKQQTGTGAGKEAVKSADSVNVPIAQIENALLSWAPVNIDLADTPLFVDEGFLGSDNTRLWQESTWQISYDVFNTAFFGLGAHPDIDYPGVEEPFTSLAIHYGEEPVPTLLDEYIYGPMVTPPASSDAFIDAANLAGATMYDENFEVVQDKAINPDNQTRGQITTIELP